MKLTQKTHKGGKGKLSKRKGKKRQMEKGREGRGTGHGFVLFRGLAVVLVEQSLSTACEAFKRTDIARQGGEKRTL